MEEKLICIIIDDEIVDSFSKIPSDLGIHFYCIHNNIKHIDTIEMCGFVAVIAEWK